MSITRSRIVEIIVLVIFIAANLYFIYSHVCWRDEANTWLVSRDLSVISLFDYTSYGGHPFVWYFLQMPFAKLGFPYITLKFLSFGIIAASVIIIMYRIDIPLWMKAMMILSPMCIAAFVTPARNYCLCAFWVTVLCLVYNKRHDSPILYGTVLFFLLQTHLVMGGMVVICGICYGTESVLRLTKKDRDGMVLWKQILGGLLPLASGLFLLWELRDSGRLIGIVGRREIIGNKAVLFVREFWNAMVCLVGRYCALPVIFLVLALVYFMWRKTRKTWIPTVILAGTIGYQIFMGAFLYEFSYQYYTLAYVFLWYLTVCWDALPDMSFPVLRDSGNRDRQILTALFAVLVFIGMWGAMGKQSIAHFKRPFSASKGAARVLDSLPDDTVKFENVEDFGAAVVPYLEKTKLYNPFSKAEASYYNVNPDHLHHISLAEFKEIVKEMFPEADGVYILWSVNWSDMDCYIDVTDAEVDSMGLIWSSQEEYGGETISGEDFDIRYLVLE